MSTPDRLLDAAFAACVEQGFDGVSLADVATRAGVTANAVYKHFDSKSALLVATAKRALESLPYDDPALDPPERARAVARAFLAPSAAPVRRFVAELAVATPRHDDLLDLMGQWHAERITTWPAAVGSTATGRAGVKALYTLLLGACQLEVLSGIDASPRAFAARIEDAAAGLFE